MGNGEKEVRTKYTYSPDYRTVHADSALGGGTPRGEFRLEFIVTLPPEIIAETITVAEGGKPTKQVLEAESEEIRRERQVCVVMSRDTAKNLMDMIAGQLGLGQNA